MMEYRNGMYQTCPEMNGAVSVLKLTHYKALPSQALTTTPHQYVFLSVFVSYSRSSFLSLFTIRPKRHLKRCCVKLTGYYPHLLIGKKNLRKTDSQK